MPIVVAASKSGAARTITSDGKEPLPGDDERMSQPESQAIYARRKTVEPVFGQIKNSGFRGFGLESGGGVLAGCAAHNLKKIIFAALRGEVCRSSGSERP